LRSTLVYWLGPLPSYTYWKTIWVPEHHSVSRYDIYYFTTMTAYYSILGLSYGGYYALF